MSIREQLNHWGVRKEPFVFLVDFEMNDCRAWRLNELPASFKYTFGTATNYNFQPESESSFHFDVEPLTKAVYAERFRWVKKEIGRGNSYLVNLTGKHKVRTNLSPETIFSRAQAPYKIWYKDHFLCFSPETFVRIEGNRIFTHPMKGTIDADIQGAQQKIHEDYKERAEHATIVDLLRNDLSRVATDVRVNRYRYYEEILTAKKKIGQVSSEIEGQLKPEFQQAIGDLIYELLPAGSVSGAPKIKTLEIIKRAEKAPRGFYTGVAGIYDGYKLDSCVLIRYFDSQMNYFSGGGITFLSEMEKEYQEMLDKIYVPFF